MKRFVMCTPFQVKRSQNALIIMDMISNEPIHSVECALGAKEEKGVKKYTKYKIQRNE